MMELKRLLIIYILIWVFLSPCFIHGETDQQDVSALTVMFTSMNSPPQLTGWTASGGDPCGQSWKGIHCSGSRVTKINLPSLQLSGSLGYQLQSLDKLTEFDVSNNNIGDANLYNLPPNLEKLNLGGNNFNGAVPYSISTMSKLKRLNFSHNHFNSINADFTKLTGLTMMDLSYNNIPGNLSTTFSSLTSLNSLYLQNNQFTGTIDVLANLPLDNLNVENNHFTGWVPTQLQNINLHKGGNQWNSGPAPPPPPGTPPVKPRHKSGKRNDEASSGDSGGKKSGVSGGAIAGIVIALLFVGAIVGFFLVKRRRSTKAVPDIEKVDTQPFTPLASNDVQGAKSIQASSVPETKTVSFDANTFESPTINLKPPPSDRHKSFDSDEGSTKSLTIPYPVITKKVIPVPANVRTYSIADLQVATGSFNMENLIGEGSIGRVFRAEFDNGKVLAVKKIDPSALETCSEDFTAVVASVSQLHHENVTELVGYCSEHGQHLLVYEFHKNGSLHDYLHLIDEYSKPLTWNSRVKIALGSARALEYLHEVCSPSVVHKNFKSENILLDGELNPHLSDCGLANLYPADQAMNQNACAPEVADSGQYTIQSDVYSFGVVMLELLSGRKPFDSSRARSEQSLVRWATPQLHDIDALTKMVDPSLEGLFPVKSLSRFADVIALCVQPEPEFRPPMSEVVQALVRLVQRTNLSKRTVGTASKQSENSDTTDQSL